MRVRVQYDNKEADHFIYKMGTNNTSLDWGIRNW